MQRQKTVRYRIFCSSKSWKQVPIQKGLSKWVTVPPHCRVNFSCWEEWGGPGCVGVERCPGCTISTGENRMCGMMLFVLKQKWTLTSVKMKFSRKAGLEGQGTLIFNFFLFTIWFLKLWTHTTLRFCLHSWRPNNDAQGENVQKVPRGGVSFFSSLLQLPGRECVYSEPVGIVFGRRTGRRNEWGGWRALAVTLASQV